MDELEFIEPPLEIKVLYIAFSKKAANYKQKLKDFNIGLEQIKEDGTMYRIISDHGF
jgi:polar amino acid transport system substrate-binding protein